MNWVIKRNGNIVQQVVIDTGRSNIFRELVDHLAH